MYPRGRDKCGGRENRRWETKVMTHVANFHKQISIRSGVLSPVRQIGYNPCWA